MNVGYRIFVVNEDSVLRISQQSFFDFYLRDKPSLARFSDQEITVAIAVCELRDRKPISIIRIDTRRVKVGAQGEKDAQYYSEKIQLIARHVLGDGSRRDFHGGTVVDALTNFDERRWAQMHPELSGQQLKQILESLFGCE